MVISALTSKYKFSNAFVVVGTAFVQFAFVHLDNAFVQLSNALRTAFAHFASLPQGNGGAKDSEQRRLFLLYKDVGLSVTDYGLGLTTIARTYLLKPDRVQNEAMRVLLGTTKDTPAETLQDLPPMQTRQKVEQVKTYFSAVENPHTQKREKRKKKRKNSIKP